MKIKAEFIREVIASRVKLTPKYFYFAKCLFLDPEPGVEIWQVKRTPTSNTFLFPEDQSEDQVTIRISNPDLVETVGVYEIHAGSKEILKFRNC